MRSDAQHQGMLYVGRNESLGKGRKLNDVVYKKTNSGGRVPYSPLRRLGMGKQDCRLSDLYLEHKQAWRIHATLIDEMFGTELLSHHSVVC